nr:DNA-directed DNA polymerase [Tanacetum cinerariifolium]
MADRTMEELLQAPTKGYGEAIVIPEILAENFEIKTNLLQLVQTNKFHGFERDNPHTHINNFKRMTATLKYKDVSNDAIKLMLFPYSLEGAARIWYEKEPPNSILTWDDLVNKFVNQFFPPSKTTHLKNKISRFTQRFEETFGEAWDRFKKILRACPHHGFSKLTQLDTFYNGLTEQDQDSLNAASGGNLLNKKTREALKIIENKSKVHYSRSKLNVSRVNTNSRDVVIISPAKAIEKTCVTCGGAHAYYECIATDSNQSSVCAATGSYNQVSPPNRASHQIPPPGFAPVQNNPNRFNQNKGTLSSNTVPNPKGEMKAVTTRSGLAYEGLSIPTNSPLEKVDEQNTEEILDKEHSNSSESIAQVQPPVVPILILKPDVLRTQSKLTIMYPSRLNDQKLRENATNQMEKFFQIFHDLHFDISFADALLLMPKFSSTIKSLLANKDKLFELAKGWRTNPTRMTLELVDRSITRPKGVAKDLFIKVGKFHFPTDFVVVDFEADPRVPLILGRSFLRTGRALIDVYGEEITLRTLLAKILCRMLDLQYNSKSSSPTLVSDDLIFESDSCNEPIVKSSSPTLTPFGESDFFLKEIEDFLNDDSIPTGIENSMYDPEGDILFLKKLLNEDPFQLLSMDLKLAEESKAKSFVEEPPELELKELPSHLEYAFLEDSNKLPKISDIKGIDPRFCIQKILMDDDYKPAVQSQRRVNPKIHDVIKKEVIKLLDAGMIYPISDSPWVSPIHCVPKKGGMTVVANENNELILTRLVIGWRVCIDYRKLNDATRKDHFPLPFMDQMLERLAGNEFYCFLDGTFQRCMMSIFHDMIEKTMEVFMDDFSVFGDSFSSCLNNLEKMLNRCEETNLVLNWEKCHFMCREGIVLGYKISKSGIEVDKAKVDVIAKLPHPTTVKGVRSFLGHAGFYRRFIQDFSKIAGPMTHLLEKETPFVFSKESLKYLLNKQDAKPRLLRWVLLLQEFDITIRDKKGSENLTADYLSRLENPHQDVLENKDNNENFPLDTLGSLTSHSTPWFADIAIFHARNFIKKGLTSQQKKKFFKDLLTSSKLAMRDLLGAIIVPISQRRRGREKYLKKMRCLRTSDKLDNALWAFRTAYKTLIGCTSYKLVYGKSCHFPIELENRAYWALKHVNFDLKTAGDHRKLQLNELSELRDQAYENYVIYKEWTKKLHDSKIKNRIFNFGDQVLLFNSRLKIFYGKLKTRCSGRFTITRVFPYGTIELSQHNGLNFKVNGHRVKHYFGGDIPSNVASDLHTFPMDN